MKKKKKKEKSVGYPIGEKDENAALEKSSEQTPVPGKDEVKETSPDKEREEKKKEDKTIAPATHDPEKKAPPWLNHDPTDPTRDEEDIY